MPLFKQTLSALMLTLYAATAAAISVPTPEEAKRQGLGLCFPRENPKPPASVYYAKRSSPYPKMLMFIDKNDEEELALICVFGPQEKEWWSVTYDTDGLLRQAWLHKKNPKSGDYGQTASYNRDRKGFYGGNMDGKFDFISEAKMLKILGMKSPYLREEIKLLEKIR